MQEEKITPFQYIWAAILGCSTNLLLNSVFIFLKLHEHVTSYQTAAASIYSGSIFKICICTILFFPILEELLFRKYLYTCISKKIGKIPGIIFSALLFGICHRNILQAMYGFLMALLFLYIYDRYYSHISAPILTHMSANTISVLGSTYPLGIVMTDCPLIIILLSGSISILVYNEIEQLHKKNLVNICKHNLDTHTSAERCTRQWRR